LGSKLKFILSDLHLGAGYAGDAGNQLEDFIADPELVSFLHDIQHESDREQAEVELIINGDFFEFLQVPAVEKYSPGELYPPEAYLDSSERASVQRLSLIARGHPEVFDALSDFMHVDPKRRITIIKGNHDVNLFWPRVKSRLREILGASGTRASLLLFADEFVSREKIYVEHGHQRAEKINAYLDFFNPRSPDDHAQLYYPVGSRFVIGTFNTMEHQHWFVDHIKPVTAFIWNSLAWNFDTATQMLLDFAGYCETNETFAGNAGLNPFLQDLQDAAKRRHVSIRYAQDETFRGEFHQQLQQILCSRGVNDDAFDPPAVGLDPLEIGQACQHQQHNWLRSAAAGIAQREGARIIVFGHTHSPVQETLENGSTYINAGSWIEDFSQATPEIWRALFDGSRLPGKQAAPLSYVRIEYDADDVPTGKLKFFHQPQNNHREKTGWLARLLGTANHNI
jgi:UDP-2,3-diacylglucosamine pyrophosphatase LpxH